MRPNFSNRIKIFLIAVLVLLVAGMTMLGILGFNQTVDNKPSYEMQVSVDQIAGDSVEILKSSSQNAVDSVIGAGAIEYSVQELNDGAVIVYKFNKDVTSYATGVETAIQTALDASEKVKGVKADVVVYENLGSYDAQTGNAVLAVSIAVAVIFVYSLIMNKLSGGVAVLCSSILSVLLFTSLMAITRIPAQPFFAILGASTVALSSAIALSLTSRYKAVLKSEEKILAFEVAEKVNKSFRIAFIALSVCVLIAAVIAGVIGLFASMFLGLGILVAGVSAVVSAVYMTPFMWSLIKGKKK